MKKYLSIIFCAALIIAVGVLFWRHQSPVAQLQTNTSEPRPAIVGALVKTNDTHTSITLASNSGEQKTFDVSYKTPVLSLVAAGSVARGLDQLNLGDVMAVTADPNNPAVVQKLELIPMQYQSLFDGSASTITGTLVSQTPTSITITPTNMAAGIPGDITITLNKNTAILSEVHATQKGKLLSDATAGTKLSILGSKDKLQTAAIVEILLP